MIRSLSLQTALNRLKQFMGQVIVYPNNIAANCNQAKELLQLVSDLIETAYSSEQGLESGKGFELDPEIETTIKDALELAQQLLNI